LRKFRRIRGNDFRCGAHCVGQEDDMESVRFDRERGQILVQVAFMVVALFAFVALALDGGQIYARRRQMQNAADAGALAGAQELCFGEERTAEAAEAAALNYAIDRNDAQWASVDVQDEVTVTVETSRTFDTFLAGIIGINTANVSAEAAAVCAKAVSVGGLWPLAFEFDVYSDSIECGESFWVFAQDEILDCVGSECECVEPGSGITETTSECEDRCNCWALGTHIGPGDRGWLRFWDPVEGLPDPCGPHNCGASEMNCWIDNGFSGIVELGDCLPGQSGVDASAKSHVNARISDTVSIVLYDRECYVGEGSEDDPDLSGTCPGTPYHVAGFGCMQIIEWTEIDVPSCGDPDTACKDDGGKKLSNLKVIKVKKVCEGTDPHLYDLWCSSPSGSSSGELPDDIDVRSVSLVK
jgi:hypothetical protein